MEYKKEIDELFYMIRSDWMDDDDFDGFIKLLEEETNITPEILDESLVVGVENGISIEEQMSLMKPLLEQIMIQCG